MLRRLSRKGDRDKKVTDFQRPELRSEHHFELHKGRFGSLGVPVSSQWKRLCRRLTFCLWFSPQRCLVNCYYMGELCQAPCRQWITKTNLVATTLQMKFRDHSFSITGFDANKYRLLEPSGFFPPGNRICVPVTASSSMKNIAPVLSMNGEVGQRYFPLSAPQAKLGNTHTSILPFSLGAAAHHRTCWAAYLIAKGELCSGTYC